MPKKVKSAKTDKKPKAVNSFKDLLQQNQIVNELVKVISARAEDVCIVNSLLDSGQGLLKQAASVLAEVEAREVGRRADEEALLGQLKTSKLEASFHKKKFELALKKMMLINAKFEEKPSQALLSATEIHTHKIMNTKLSEDSIKVNIGKKSQNASSEISEALWYENYSKAIRILDCMLLGEIIDLYSPVLYCVSTNRNIFCKAYENIVTLLRNGDENEGITEEKKIIIELDSSEKLVCETNSHLFCMFEGFNQKIQKGIRSYVMKCLQEGNRAPKIARIRNSKEKNDRNLNYKAQLPINPYRASVNTHRKKWFDIENAFFKATTTLEETIKIIHSCIVIQRFIRYRNYKKFISKSVIIQKWIRGFLARKRFLLKKTQKFRKLFFTMRIKHWVQLIARKHRERKSGFVKRDYKKCTKEITIIQKFVRSYLARKSVYWKKVFHALKQQKNDQRLYLQKQLLWKSCFFSESSAVMNTKSAEEDLNSFITQIESKPKKPSRSSIEELIKSHLKNDSEFRSSYFAKAHQNRIQTFEDNF